jgi:dihydroorotase
MQTVDEISEVINSIRQVSGVGVCYYDLENFFNYGMMGVKNNIGHYCEFCEKARGLKNGRDNCTKSDRVTAVTLAKEYGAQLHVAHLTTKEELTLIDPADSNITAEVCIPHLVFTDADYATLGTRIKCNPAVKDASHRTALRSALTNGKIATIATDHAPHLMEEKKGGALTAVSGMPMVQFSLVSMLELVNQGVLPLEQLVALMSHNPAQRFSVKDRGFLRKGYKADLVIVRPNTPWTLTPETIKSKCGWSPLEGRTFDWKVEKTFCNGVLVYADGSICPNAALGERVTFDR